MLNNGLAGLRRLRFGGGDRDAAGHELAALHRWTVNERSFAVPGQSVGSRRSPGTLPGRGNCGPGAWWRAEAVGAALRRRAHRRSL